ncbi:hypothetical protein CV103_05240 [Sphingomonas fennica]|uniref:Uncharacterized protein n=1 Tax=Edaphosphingomonas fennica TaxID=114404 RepID=A0A2T4I5K3_9SPHN|nr:hypothetical protein CV103_05240 [Sphingomonas fennica]
MVAASDTFLTVDAKSLMKRRLPEDKFLCVMNAASVSNLEERGVFFGFIGNEAYRSDGSD